jgi:hypothetical protein
LPDIVEGLLDGQPTAGPDRVLEAVPSGMGEAAESVLVS